MPATSLSHPITSSRPPPQARYVACGEPAAEARVVQDLARVATGVDSEVGDALRALVLVGAFARGEGGIVERDGEPHAAEPGYQLLALFKHWAERQQPALSAMAANWTRLLNARVTIRALPARVLAAPPPTRFWFHAGRRQLVTLVGDPLLVGTIPRFDPRDLRGEEAAYALCEGFAAVARASLEPRVPELELVDRMHRLILLCGDALLLRRGQYAESMRARAESVDATCTSAPMRDGYRIAMDYCARPDSWSPPAGDVQSWLASTRRWLSSWYLDVEALRIGTPRDLLGYVRFSSPLCAAAENEPRGPLFAGLLRAFPFRGAKLAGWVQPLERLLRASAALALAPYLPAAREHASGLLQLASAPSEPASDTSLARGLRTLSRLALEDGVSHPFIQMEARL